MTLGITLDELVSYYPRLCHVAVQGSWHSILKHGLLSTKALLELFDVPQARRRLILERHRPESVVIEHPSLGGAVIRDQKPMDDKGLKRALSEDLTPTKWYRVLNGMVFFWLTRKRVDTFLGARAYRTTEHILLTVDSKALLDEYASRILLSPLNSGCTKPFPHPRGADTFQPLSTYPFQELKRRRATNDAVVELAVPEGVRDIRKFVLRVDKVKAGGSPKLIWRP